MTVDFVAPPGAVVRCWIRLMRRPWPTPSCWRAGWRPAEKEGYDAVLRQFDERFRGPRLCDRFYLFPLSAQVSTSLLTACALGKKFSIITMWGQLATISYDKVISEQGLGPSPCIGPAPSASRPDTSALLAGKEEVVFPRSGAGGPRGVGSGWRRCSDPRIDHHVSGA